MMMTAEYIGMGEESMSDESMNIIVILKQLEQDLDGHSTHLNGAHRDRPYAERSLAESYSGWKHRD